jgi:hypothetical protein
MYQMGVATERRGEPGPPSSLTRYYFCVAWQSPSPRLADADNHFARLSRGSSRQNVAACGVE